MEYIMTSIQVLPQSKDYKEAHIYPLHSHFFSYFTEKNGLATIEGSPFSRGFIGLLPQTPDQILEENMMEHFENHDLHHAYERMDEG
jgi:hypothetical protein